MKSNQALLLAICGNIMMICLCDIAHEPWFLKIGFAACWGGFCGLIETKKYQP